MGLLKPHLTPIHQHQATVFMGINGKNLVYLTPYNLLKDEKEQPQSAIRNSNYAV